jgi:hypothetical protein
MQGSISLTNQKQSVVSGREFAICCQRFHFEGNFLLKGIFCKMKEI